MKSPFRAHNPVRVPDGIQLHTRMKIIDYKALKSSTAQELRKLVKELELEAHIHADTDMEDYYMDVLEIVEAELETRVHTPVYWTEEKLNYLKANIYNENSAFPVEHLDELIEHLLTKEWTEISKGERHIRFKHGTRTINFYTWMEMVHVTYHRN